MQTPLTASEYLLVEDCSIWTEKRPLPVWRETLVPGLISVLSATVWYWWVSWPQSGLVLCPGWPSLQVNIINSTNIWKINYKWQNCQFGFCDENVWFSSRLHHAMSRTSLAYAGSLWLSVRNGSMYYLRSYIIKNQRGASKKTQLGFVLRKLYCIRPLA